jgi:pantoate ligase/cytidylate kinase
MQQQGLGAVSIEGLQTQIAERDRLDSTRAVAPLQKAPDAIEIQTDGLSVEEVVDKIVSCYQQKFSAAV